LIDPSKKINGRYFEFKRENEKWFALILDSSFHGNGFGTKILELAKQNKNELNG
jgi:hypothetical protein